MKIVIIGGSGHIGTFLVPRLVRAGPEVVSISKSYVEATEWQQVRQVVADREQEDRDGTFGERIAALQSDVVVDLVCFQKDNIARTLKEETGPGGLITTSLHPGHIVGLGWHPIGPLGSLDPAVWHTLSAGQPLQVPGSGTDVMHHVHAGDLAQAFEKAVGHRDAAAGEDFNIVAPTALTVRGYAEIAAGWFGQQVVLETVSWEQFRATTTPEHADTSWRHLYRNHCFTIEKAKSLLGYAPRYEPEEAVLESVQWLIEHDQLSVARPLDVLVG